MIGAYQHKYCQYNKMIGSINNAAKIIASPIESLYDEVTSAVIACYIKPKKLSKTSNPPVMSPFG